jgi:hypothetical protein
MFSYVFTTCNDAFLTAWYYLLTFQFGKFSLVLGIAKAHGCY